MYLRIYFNLISDIKYYGTIQAGNYIVREVIQLRIKLRVFICVVYYLNLKSYII